MGKLEFKFEFQGKISLYLHWLMNCAQDAVVVRLGGMAAGAGGEGGHGDGQGAAGAHPAIVVVA